MIEPLREKGAATLKSGQHIYTYLPKTDRTIKLTSGMMIGSWMGSHLINDNLVKEARLEDDYNAEISFEGERDGNDIIGLYYDFFAPFAAQAFFRSYKPGVDVLSLNWRWA